MDAAESRTFEIVAELLEVAFGERSILLESTHYPTETADRIERALMLSQYSTHARDIAFHLSDWLGDAAALLCVHLYPERFTDEEIVEAVEGCIVHAPNHLAAAAACAGLPVANIFEAPLPFVDQT